MKEEIRTFFTALMFYTRIPCPSWTDHSEEYLNKANKYIPVIGWIVGGITAVVFYLCTYAFNQPIAVLLSMITGILVTGAFHEDGFADVCDGFGGGWSQSQILNIMKDSRVGAYGVIGILLILLLKFLLLSSIPFKFVPIALVLGHTLSRYIASSLMYTLEYVREDETSKVKPIAKSFPLSHVIIATCFTLITLLLLPHPLYLLTLIPLFLIRAHLSRYFKKWIGGYTGDCLGATQQVAEVFFYLGFCLMTRYV